MPAAQRQGPRSVAKVPGVQKSDIKIETKDNTIRSAGQRLPLEIDADGIKAECRAGLLALYVPRARTPID